MSWKIYILKCADGSFYTGSTNNLVQRIAKHQSGKGAKYTRGRCPLKLVYSENCANQSEALKREIEIKKLSRGKKQLLIKSAKLL